MVKLTRPGICARTGKRFLHEPRPGVVIFRKGGRHIHTFKAREGTPEFDDEYWEVMTGRTQEAKRGWAAAIDLLRKSDRWAAKSPRYRADLEPVLEYLTEKIGKRDVTRLTQADIYQAMDANKHRVRFANYLPVAISMIAKEVIRRRWLTENPALGIERLEVPKERRRPHIPWTDWAVDTWRADAQEQPRLIFELGVGTVQRPSDWLQFAYSDYDGDTLHLRQGKTGVPLVLPCTVALKAALDSAKASLPYSPHPNLRIIHNKDGSPMSYRTMAQIMRAERKRLGVEAFDLHALRYRGVMELAWAGCTDDEIMSYSGHATKEMVRKYAGEARQIMRARQAREKRQ